MNIEDQNKLQQIIIDDFENMKEMLNRIRDNILPYHPNNQFHYYRALQQVILDAWLESKEENHPILSKEDNPDTIIE